MADQRFGSHDRAVTRVPAEATLDLPDRGSIAAAELLP